METSGTLYKKFDAQQITERFRKREFVLELTDSRYPQLVQFQLTGDKCEWLDPYEVGDVLKIEFNLRGREWTSPKGDVKYFNSLDVWKLEKQGATDAPPDDDEPPVPDGPPPDVEDLPF